MLVNILISLWTDDNIFTNEPCHKELDLGRQITVMVSYPYPLTPLTFRDLYAEARPGSLPLSALTNKIPRTLACYRKAALV